MSENNKRQSILNNLHILSRALAEWQVEVYDKPVIREWVEKKYKEIINEIAERIVVDNRIKEEK